MARGRRRLLFLRELEDECGVCYEFGFVLRAESLVQYDG